jgi:hypothetical protein
MSFRCNSGVSFTLRERSSRNTGCVLLSMEVHSISIIRISSSTFTTYGQNLAPTPMTNRSGLDRLYPALLAHRLIRRDPHTGYGRTRQKVRSTFCRSHTGCLNLPVRLRRIAQVGLHGLEPFGEEVFRFGVTHRRSNNAILPFLPVRRRRNFELRCQLK